MIGRRAALAGVLALFSPSASRAQPAAAAAPQASRRPRRVWRQRRPVEIPQGQARPVLRGDPAPLPNREARSPGDSAPPRTRIEADLLTSRVPGGGASFGEDAALLRRDRLHQPAPGAAVRVPFSF